MEQHGGGNLPHSRGSSVRGRGRGLVTHPQQLLKTSKTIRARDDDRGGDGAPYRPQQLSQQPSQAWPIVHQQAPGQAPTPRPLGIPQVVEGPRAPTPSVAGRASIPVDEKISYAKEAAGTAEVATSAAGQTAHEEGRGMIRGKRVITEIVHTRPSGDVSKMGRKGKRITVQTNYYRIDKKPEWSIHQYRVDFAPNVDMIRVRRAYLAHHRELFGGYIFDGTIMFSCAYDPSPMELLTKNREGETIQIKVKHVGIVNPTDIQQLQVLNLVLRRAMEGLNLQLVGRNYFDPAAKIDLNQYKIELWPGYTTSIRQHERDILLCCEISHKVMRTDSLYTILSLCTREESNVQDAFKRQVVGSIVLTDYNNKTYRVDDVDFTKNPNSTFDSKEGPVKYCDYYKKRYNITIRDLKQPLLVSRPTEKNVRGGEDKLIMLIPELSRATGITDAMRNNFRLMKAMSEHTRLTPERRIERLDRFNKRLHESKESMESFRKWNMKLETNLVEVAGRVLDKELILFGANGTYNCNSHADWTMEFRKREMFCQVDIKRWIVICPERNAKEVQNFVRLCMQVSQGMNMQIANPRYQTMADDRNNSYSQAIDNAVSQDPQLLMVILVKKSDEKYSCVKKKCCVDRPIPSQVCVLTTIAPRAEKSGGLMSIATKVVIQMNAKLGGAPWLVEIPPKGVMFVGFDVCHSAKEKNTSFGALVATMDMKKSTCYFSNVMQHMKGQELSNQISLSMTMALRAYRDTHGELPSRIIFYRDGVGDGQLHQVANTEIQYLKQQLDTIYEANESFCKMAFIVVSKRINTRYFTNRQNPEPGTVVDDIITLPERYDFFLVSQSVRQGTVSPTSYNVIFDNTGWSADQLQALTYKQTHMYYNWSGTCRVPAVCQYAHKLASLIAEHIHRKPSSKLELQLYFL